MADKRAWAKFDVGYLDNPKMADVLDASCNAILMHFASVLYCSQHLTDGGDDWCTAQVRGIQPVGFG